MILPAGQLNATIDFQQDNGAQNSYGEVVPSWQNIHSGIWCLWESAGKGDDDYSSNQKVSKERIKVTINYYSDLSDVDGSKRVVYGVKPYRIIGEPRFEGYRGASLPDLMILDLERLDND